MSYRQEYIWTVQPNDKVQNYKKYKSTKVLIVARHQTARGQNTKLSITQSFFELQTPDFAWKFVWTAHRDLCKKLNFRDSKILKLGKMKVMAITCPFLDLQTPDFEWK